MLLERWDGLVVTMNSSNEHILGRAAYEDMLSSNAYSGKKKVFWYFIFIFNYQVDSRIPCHTQIFIPIICNLLQSKQCMGNRRR